MDRRQIDLDPLLPGRALRVPSSAFSMILTVQIPIDGVDVTVPVLSERRTLDDLPSNNVAVSVLVLADRDHIVSRDSEAILLC